MPAELCVSLRGFCGHFNNEAVRGCSIRLEGVHLREALGVDPEGKGDHEVAAVEGRKKAAADILSGESKPNSIYWKGREQTNLQQEEEAVG